MTVIFMSVPLLKYKTENTGNTYAIFRKTKRKTNKAAFIVQNVKYLVGYPQNGTNPSPDGT